MARRMGIAQRVAALLDPYGRLQQPEHDGADKGHGRIGGNHAQLTHECRHGDASFVLRRVTREIAIPFLARLPKPHER